MESRSRDACRLLRKAALIVLLGASLAAAVAGASERRCEQGGTVTGVAMDSNMRSLRGLTITLLRIPQIPMEATCDAESRFRFEGVPPGTYLLYVDVFAFRPSVQAGIVVPAGSGITVPLEVREEGVVCPLRALYGKNGPPRFRGRAHQDANALFRAPTGGSQLHTYLESDFFSHLPGG